MSKDLAKDLVWVFIGMTFIIMFTGPVELVYVLLAVILVLVLIHYKYSKE